MHRGVLTATDADEARRLLEGLPIQVREPDDLYAVAWQLASHFGRPTIYDSLYLALAAIVGCELWTADHRLANAVSPHLPWVRLLDGLVRWASVPLRRADRGSRRADNSRDHQRATPGAGSLASAAAWGENSADLC